MSQVKLTADSGGGTVAIKGPASTTGNAAIELTLPGTASGTLAVGDTGKILQVKQAVKTDTSSTTNFSWVTIPGTDESGSGSEFEVNITPAATSSKILVTWGIHLSVAAGVYTGGLKLRRGTTDIFIGDTNSSRTRATNWVVGWNSYGDRNPFFLGGSYLDSPNTTSATTYSLQYTSGYSSTAIYINRSYNLWDDAQAVGVVPSSITCMEVAG